MWVKLIVCCSTIKECLALLPETACLLECIATCVDVTLLNMSSLALCIQGSASSVKLNSCIVQVGISWVDYIVYIVGNDV